MEEARTNRAGSWLGAVRRLRTLNLSIRSLHTLVHSLCTTVRTTSTAFHGRNGHEVSGGLIFYELTRRATLATSRSACNPSEIIGPPVGVSTGHRSPADPPPGAAGLTGLALARTVRRSLSTATVDRCLPPHRCRRGGQQLTSYQPLKMWEFSREQAHFPAKQPAPQPHPWLSSADEDPRRSRHPRCPPAQGSRRVVGLIESFTDDGVAATAQDAQLGGFSAGDEAGRTRK